MSPGWRAAEVAITTHFAARWTTAPGVPRTPVHWPDDAAFRPPHGLAWARLTIRWGEGRRVALGPSLDRHTGVVIVQLFTPAGQGHAANTALCDAAGEALNDVRLPCEGGRVVFSTASLEVIGNDRGGGPWWQQNVSAPFRRDKS